MFLNLNEEISVDSAEAPLYGGTMVDKDKLADDMLIALCLEQDAEAWEILVRRYQRLISSVTQKYKLSHEDAADVLQAVFFTLFQQLSVLRQQEKIGSWILTVTARECWKLAQRPVPDASLDDEELQEPIDPPDENQLAQDDSLWMIERQHLLRQTVASMAKPCNTLLTELFFRDNPLPYAELSRELGLPIPSIGPTRARCLDKLKAELKKNGFF